jgi:hypothetical protein
MYSKHRSRELAHRLRSAIPSTVIPHGYLDEGYLSSTTMRLPTGVYRSVQFRKGLAGEKTIFGTDRALVPNGVIESWRGGQSMVRGAAFGRNRF